MIGLFLFCFLSLSEPLSHHKAHLERIDHRLRQQEADLKHLELNKSHAREGQELENILNDIAKIHMQLLQVKKERAELKRHLRNEHPNDDLMFDARLHKDKELSHKNESNDPVDKKLDELIVLMQSQYARFAKTSKKIPEKLTHKDVSESETVESSKERYLNKAIQTQMKIKNQPSVSEKKETPPHAPSTEKPAEHH